MKQANLYKNKLGMGGWVSAGRYGLSRYLYTLQRISGLGLILFLLLHLVETSSRIHGGAAWEATMSFLDSPVFLFFEWIVFIGFIFHAINGIRLILLEFGIALGKPGRPIFPYVSSVQRQRPLMLSLMVIVMLLVVFSLFEFFVW